MEDAPVAPPLPSGSVDFNAVHEAALKGDDLVMAVTHATFRHPDAEDAPAPSSAYSIEHSGGGHYLISGPGLDEPEKVRGKDEAEARAAFLDGILAAGHAPTVSAPITPPAPPQPIVDVDPDADTGE